MPAIMSLAGLPAQCGECGEHVPMWPLTITGHRLHLVCPHCHVTGEPVLAVASEDGCE